MHTYSMKCCTHCRKWQLYPTACIRYGNFALSSIYGHQQNNITFKAFSYSFSCNVSYTIKYKLNEYDLGHVTMRSVVTYHMIWYTIFAYQMWSVALNEQLPMDVHYFAFSFATQWRNNVIYLELLTNPNSIPYGKFCEWLMSFIQSGKS